MGIFLLGFMFFFLGHSSFAKEDFIAKTLHLEIGDSRVLAFESGRNLKLSKKNIVSAKHLKEGKWLVTAVRAGQVLIEEEGEQGALLMIFVRKFKEPTPHSLFDKAGKYNFLCMKANIICLRDQMAISGKTDDWQLFYRIEEVCEEVQPCLSRLALSKTGQNSIRSEIDKQFPDCETTILGFRGKIIVDCLCERDKTERQQMIDFISVGGLKRGSSIFLSCRSSKKRHPLILSLRFFTSFDSQLNEQGFETELQSLPRPFALTRWRLKQEKGNLHLLGHPVLRLLSGEKVKLQSGLQTPKALMAIGSSYFRRGLDIQAQVRFLDSSQSRLALKVSFPRQQHADGTMLTGGNLETQVIVPHGKPLMIGEFEGVTHLHNQRSMPYFEKLPIVGPLFRQQLKGKTIIKIHVAAQLDFDNGQSLEGAKLRSKSRL